MSTDFLIPADFTSVAVALASDRDGVLGYRGSARYVGFYWEPAADVLAWFDGKSLTVGHGDTDRFFRQVVPLSILHGVNLGSRGEATHFFVWDHVGQCGYLAPWQSALDFLEAQGGAIDPAPLIAFAQVPPLA